MADRDDYGINLDGMSVKDVEVFLRDVNAHPRLKARELFPDRPEGYVTATQMLGMYAAEKAQAMRDRMACRITSALSHEDTCDQIYDKLPPFARW